MKTPSDQSLANKKHYEILAVIMAQTQPLEEQTEFDEDADWAALSAEPGDVDYIEADADGVKAMWVAPKGSVEDRVIFYAHGGGFVSGSINTHQKMVGHLAKAAGCRALMFEYAYADAQHLYPHQLNTTMTAYRWLLGQGIKAKHIALGGDSCGAILMFGVLQQARSEELPQPAAVLILSGWLDMELTGESYETNREKDIFFSRETVDWLTANILGEKGDRRNPLANPLYADLTGFPPVYLQAGADETLVDDSRMFAMRAKEAGVEVKFDVFPHMLHSFQMMAGRAPEADEAIARLAKWAQPKLELK